MAKTAQEKADLKAEKLYEKTHKNRYRTSDMLPSYRTMEYKSPIWGYFHVQKE